VYPCVYFVIEGDENCSLLNDVQHDFMMTRLAYFLGHLTN